VSGGIFGVTTVAGQVLGAVARDDATWGDVDWVRVGAMAANAAISGVIRGAATGAAVGAVLGGIVDCATGVLCAVGAPVASIAVVVGGTMAGGAAGGAAGQWVENQILSATNRGPGDSVGEAALIGQASAPLGIIGSAPLSTSAGEKAVKAVGTAYYKEALRNRLSNASTMQQHDNQNAALPSVTSMVNGWNNSDMTNSTNVQYAASSYKSSSSGTAYK